MRRKPLRYRDGEIQFETIEPLRYRAGMNLIDLYFVEVAGPGKQVDGLLKDLRARMSGVLGARCNRGILLRGLAVASNVAN